MAVSYTHLDVYKRQALDEAGLKFIVGSRVTKAPADLASHFRWHGDAFTDGQVIDTITPRAVSYTHLDVYKRQGQRGHPHPVVNPREYSEITTASTSLSRR